MSSQKINITPKPHILRTLGEIPFEPWQCIAELIDNSIDAFLSSPEDVSSCERKITVNWDGDNVAEEDRTLQITDNACGMTREQVRNAVCAGYTSNNPLDQLGLFGMGFNIATARLGEVTTILSTKKGDAEWVGVCINFDELIRNGTFEVPVLLAPKDDINESGTKITVTRLKDGIWRLLRDKEADIRRRLGSVYAPILLSPNKSVEILVKGHRLRPRRYCVWGENRYVMHKNEAVHAIQKVDYVFGKELFNTARNCYLTPAESDKYSDLRDDELPCDIVWREQRLTGWVGIQRYSDPDDFGLDFIRNGRKILISNKDLFSYENPVTGQRELQYPVNLGSTVGGRIVGELHVDYLLPTYQKNDFNRSDASWQKTVLHLCGRGPFRPKRRKELGFTEDNDSVLSKLCVAYQRSEAGTKNLIISSQAAKNMAEKFYKGDPDYQSDKLWWQAVLEEDQKKGLTKPTTPVDPGDELTDDPNQYLDMDDDTPSADRKDTGEVKPLKPKPIVNPPAAEKNSTLEEVLKKSERKVNLSNNYYGFGKNPRLDVDVYELKQGKIWNKGSRVPCLFQSEGSRCKFVYDPMHPTLSQYLITPKTLLLLYVSEKLKARDRLTDLVDTFSLLVEETMSDEKLDLQMIQARAKDLLECIRQDLDAALSSKAKEVVEILHESSSEVEVIANNIMGEGNNQLVLHFQEKEADAYGVLAYVPYKALVRLVERFPEDVFDGKVFSTLYKQVNFSDGKLNESLRKQSKERIVSFLTEICRIVTGASTSISKEDLARASMCMDLLTKEMVH